MTEQLGSGSCSSDSEGSDAIADSEYCAHLILRELNAECQALCSSALAKCVPRKNMQPDVCTLSVHSVRKRRRVQNVSPESFSSEFHVMRPILMEFSEYFRRCFAQEHFEVSGNIVRVYEFDADVTAAFVEFLYTGVLRDEFVDSHCFVCELARMAKYYQVTLLQRQCCAHLSVQAFHHTSMKFVLDNLLAIGFGLEELCDLGCSLRLLRQLRMTPSDYFKTIPTSVDSDIRCALLLLSRRRLRSETGCVQVLQMRGWSTRSICMIGFSLDEMRSGGVLVGPQLFFSCGAVKSESSAMYKLIAGGYSVTDLLADGITSLVMQRCIPHSHIELRKHGYTHEDLISLGYSARLLSRS